MFFTTAGTPAGYGYLKETAGANEDIWPRTKKSLFTLDGDKDLGAPIIAGTVRITVDTDTTVSINGRSPCMIKASCPLWFNARGITSIVFTDSVKFDITISY